MDTSTQGVRRRLIEHMLQEPIKPGSLVLYGDVKVSALSPKALEVLRDRKADLPEAANARVKTLRMLFKWGKKAHPDHIRGNPARDVERVEHSSQGHHTWTVEDVARYEERHPVGTKARLALCLVMWTGVRRSDLVLLDKQHQYWQIDPVTTERKRWLKFTAHKNRNRNPVVIDIPVLPELIAASPTGDLTFLVTEYGQRFSAPGFGNKFREWCNQAGLPHCSAHGLRKAGATSAAENGASTHELMSIFGWLTMQEAERDTRAARRKKMAGNAMGLLVRKD